MVADSFQLPDTAKCSAPCRISDNDTLAIPAPVFAHLWRLAGKKGSTKAPKRLPLD